VTAGSLVDSFSVTVGGYTREGRLLEAEMRNGARALLIDCPELFDREALYGTDSRDYPAITLVASRRWSGRARVCRAARHATFRGPRA